MRYGRTGMNDSIGLRSAWRQALRIHWLPQQEMF